MHRIANPTPYARIANQARRTRLLLSRGPDLLTSRAPVGPFALCSKILTAPVGAVRIRADWFACTRDLGRCASTQFRQCINAQQRKLRGIARSFVGVPSSYRRSQPSRAAKAPKSRGFPPHRAGALNSPKVLGQTGWGSRIRTWNGEIRSRESATTKRFQTVGLRPERSRLGAGFSSRGCPSSWRFELILAEFGPAVGDQACGVRGGQLDDTVGPHRDVSAGQGLQRADPMRRLEADIRRRWRV